MTSAVETYLATLDGAAPDMGELHRLGVPLSEAVEICAARHKPPSDTTESESEPVGSAWRPMEYTSEEWDARRAQSAPKLNLAMYMPPVPRPASSSHKEPVHELSALSLLHTLSQMIEQGRADITVLVDQGFSPHTAEELCNLIRCANPFHVSPTGSLT